MPKNKLYALIADCTGYGHFAKYYTRFGYNGETIREAIYLYGKPLTPSPYDYPFLRSTVRPLLYSYTKGWLRRIT